MRKGIAIVLALAFIFMSGIALAENTGNGDFAGSFINDPAAVEEYAKNHTHNYEKSERNMFLYGPGLDLVVFESNSPWVETVEVQSKYDISNNEVAVYAVVKVNLWKAVTGKE